MVIRDICYKDSKSWGKRSIWNIDSASHCKKKSQRFGDHCSSHLAPLKWKKKMLAGTKHTSIIQHFGPLLDTQTSEPLAWFIIQCNQQHMVFFYIFHFLWKYHNSQNKIILLTFRDLCRTFKKTVLKNTFQGKTVKVKKGKIIRYQCVEYIRIRNRPNSVQIGLCSILEFWVASCQQKRR